jgi:PadR family transcriptional regulator PadR
LPRFAGRRARRRARGRGHSIRRFVEPCLLLLLHRGDSHGYDLLERLQEFGLGQENVDSSVVYRYLREMEERGFATSAWDTEGAGPPRRVYRLTPEGDQYLAWWIAGLEQTRQVVDRFLQSYTEHMELEDHSMLLAQRSTEVDGGN